MTPNKKSAFILLAVAAIISVSWAQMRAPKQFIVQGNVKGFTDSVVFMTYGTFNNTKIDSVKVIDGKFTFKGSVGEPLQGMLFSRNYRLRLDLYVENAAINITGNMDSLDDIKVKGSPIVNEYEVFNKEIMANRKRVNNIFTEAYNAKQAGDTAKARMLEADGNKWYAYEYEIRRNYMRKNPNSPISAREILMYVNNKTLDESTKLFEALTPAIKASEQGKELAERIVLLNKILTGKPALLFTQNDVDDKPVTLASFKGKYVLLEFWASWCGPCRAENPNLLKQKQLFGDKFSILGVSLDKAKAPWLQAIEKDGLTWTQVSDLKGWNNEIAVLYGVKAVPANFLIDPNGVIIGQDLRGEALNKKLKELFQ